MTNQRNRVSKLLMGLYQARQSSTLHAQLKAAAIAELEPRCHVVYQYCAGLPFAKFTAEETATDNGLSHAHATTVLKQLYDLGLLGREEAHNEAGKRYFCYWVR